MPLRLEQNPYQAKGDEYIVDDSVSDGYYVAVFKDYRHHPTLSYQE